MENPNIDKAITSLVRLKGMFGAIAYLINPESTKKECTLEAFKIWHRDIAEKLDDVIDLLHEK